MKWIIATSTLLILSQPAFSQQSRPCEQGDIGQTGITRCRTPDLTGATIDRSGTIDSGPTNPSATNPGSGGPVILPTDPLANDLNPNPLVGSPGATGLGTAGPQAQIPSRLPAPATVTPRVDSGRTATGVGSPGITTTPTVGSGRSATGVGSPGITTTPTVGSGRSATGVGSPGTTTTPPAGSGRSATGVGSPGITTTPRVGSGRSATGVGSAGTTTRTSPSTPMDSGRAVGKGTAGTAGATSMPGTSKKSGRKMVGAGNSVTKGTSSMPGASVGSAGKAVGGGSHRIRSMGGSRALRSHSRR